MRILGWLLVAVSVGVLGLAVVLVIALGDEYGFDAELLEVAVYAVAFAAIPAAIARSLFAKARGRELVGR